MTKPLPLTKIRAYLDAFAAIDKNGDGTITTKELRSALKTARGGSKVSKEEAKAIIRDADADASGTIDFLEYLRMAARHEETTSDSEKKARELFKNFDKDGDGFISKAEFGHVVNKLGYEMSDLKIDEIMRGAEKGGDGMLCYEEFALALQ